VAVDHLAIAIWNPES